MKFKRQLSLYVAGLTIGAIAVVAATNVADAFAKTPQPQIRKWAMYEDGSSLLRVFVPTGVVVQSRANIATTGNGVIVTVVSCRYGKPCARPKRSAAATDTYEQGRTRERALALQLVKERKQHARTVLRLTTAMKYQTNVHDAIKLAAIAYGANEAHMRTVANCESTFVPTARNGQYQGLFQFGLPLWNETPYREFPRTNPYAASLATAYVVQRTRHAWGPWECKP